MTGSLQARRVAGNSAPATGIVWRECFAPSRPLRLGTRRRRARQALAASEAGGTCPARSARANSLDTENQLATTAVEWSALQISEDDIYRQKLSIHRQLKSSVREIFEKHKREAVGTYDAVLAKWLADYDAQKAYLPDESGTEQWKRVEEWVKKNKPAGANAQWVKWEKVYFQLERCQREWIGYRPACCGDRSKPIAVPIGCNHRLCPLCAHHRSHKAQANIKTMFDRLTHPIFVTLTIPNTKTLRKHDFTLIRQRVRKFIAEHKRWFKGGVYSLETTYNRREKTWHLHVHILADADCPLPSKSERRTLAGNRLYAFTKLKLELEFDWLRLWTGDWSKPCRMDSGQMRHAGDVYQFEQWYRGTLANKVREWDYFTKSYKRAAGLSDAEFEARTEWNRRNRRMVHIRPVDDRDKAAAEVLKYITKGAQFSDSPDAIEEFMDAVKGARLIQTFGTWYGAKFDTVFDPEHMDDWGEMKCACGLNHWERMGVFYRKDVYLEADGRWRIRSEVFNRHIGGTVPRPTIRALEPEGEATGYDINGIKFFAQ